ncbi:hypothetical protein NDU88_000868 [Pleurodeles waltl]|uniref:Uncharacterized protein n=1 Tax=Pleurodeles waltl TaxID=8319 RepID=A0AAV7LFZ1_PLEWA|nr:hypothetical protein NDU88_000868 [Pleurodeles waltl]
MRKRLECKHLAVRHIGPWALLKEPRAPADSPVGDSSWALDPLVRWGKEDPSRRRALCELPAPVDSPLESGVLTVRRLSASLLALMQRGLAAPQGAEKKMVAAALSEISCLRRPDPATARLPPVPPMWNGTPWSEPRLRF